MSTASSQENLKNFSVYESELGDYVMTPAYDLLNTFLHYPGDLTFMALSLFRDPDFATPAFEYALITIAGDFGKIRSDVACPDVSVATMLKAFDAEGFSPAVFVGGKYRREVPRWYVLQSVKATDRDGREMAWNRTRPGLVERGYLWGYALFCRKSLHWVPTTSAKLKVRLLVNGLTGGRFSTFLFALRAIVHGWTVSEKHIIVQLPPHGLGDGRIECCDSCPDATVRNGRLHPVCLGDIDEEVQL